MMILKEFKTIKQNSICKIIEKKSQFIGQAYYVESKEEAEEIIKQTKKKYSDARHNCYAYIVLEENNLITKSNDDGEPSGTAGIPILNTIKEKELVTVLVIVTRYFGGILLGTGGLARAYSKSALEAIENVGIVEKEQGYEIKFITDYNRIEKLKYYLSKNMCNIVDVVYLEKIELIAEVNEKIKIEIENDKTKELFENIEKTSLKLLSKHSLNCVTLVP